MSQNEKRKDKDLTERIDRIIKYRDEVTKGVDLSMFHSRFLSPAPKLVMSDHSSEKVKQSVDKLVSPSMVRCFVACM